MPISNTCVKTGQHSVAMTQIPYPDQPGPGQALIRTTLSTICGSDMHLVDEMPIPAGVPMGHEAIGVVEAVGAGVTNFKAGDRVASGCLACCGMCKRCQEGDHSVCETFNAPGNLLFGAQGEYFLVNGAQAGLAKVPDSLSDEQVLFVTDIMSTGFAAIERAGIRTGDTVAIFAQGPVGLCATAGARALGAGRIIAVESIPERVAMSKRFGADIVLDPADAVAKIQQMTGNRGVDIAVEALGHQATFANACASVRIGGTVSSVGVYGAFPELTMATGGTFIHRKLVTTLCPVGTNRLERLMALIAGGTVDLTPLLTHSMKISDTPAGYDLFRKREGGVLKIALRP
ncbi:MAG: alcohol dehydrogenase catalytic domain-containing protein [Dehalococcoidia bacterium]|uniref:zinc-binding dehydrogenase n=1 Tax=Candidatus Amarobacter glycogenicus TaxID=3140699 RepID=UPI002A0B09E1|nr:alcohol dehydrogenase catalytic domain-containing protein [Dehalococcoidia bacterium]MBK6561417.1 alcohol dehydrogenase catalytic domain-containing protein [Dehalococcoidia bacterium]MBK7127263.1 alcohol dehydrogenase catalytic domain-containing protein [Dehalococcoidia bacterium]MBK9343074.1 alcohol dehydrogenase catalytic domain-containing protein [Dehalococcoidia bacterium]MBK9546247.1 alcohol dehydrogenase catalytic domain-containing protein [Dehalococcoidia bacterium]